ncbi:MULTISPECIES: DUF6350 family protein [unclassified Corynebacterium]|uniref:cell division protein PerM n=1 Tax=unclassified Corynebacterium TaxID=2624378 RepID=UPI0029CA6F58|nr:MULTISPECIES: DUF6350 family protein [unclassified Corynebacterium]WPF66764.1 DUF6350 family protein [Corynebacterium sp. 22KM0430]WPF69252.1 DUF6350 family protein [Corynebacterium sp. 21KM1197]
MSKKTSSNRRPGGGRRRTRREVATPTTQQEKARQRYLPTVLLPHLVVLLAIVVIAMTGLLVTSTSLGAMPATVAQLWLILNMAPIRLDGITLGLMPLLPAMGMIWLLSRARPTRRFEVGLLLGVPLLLTGIAWLMLFDARAVYPVDVPSPWAFLTTLIVHSLALLLGYRPWPQWAKDAVRYLLYLLGAAAVVWIAVVAWNWQATSPGAVAVSLLYLPNAVIAAAAVLVGAEFHAGEASISLFSVHLVPLPPLPLFAVPGQALPWAMALLLIPAGVAVALWWRRVPTWREAVYAGGCAGALTLVGTYLAGGQMGVYGATGPMEWLAALLVFVWVAGVGAAAGLVHKAAGRLSA